MESSQYSTLAFLLLLEMKKYNQYISENFRAPCFADAFNSTDLTVSQCIEPSDCRSSWSQWRTILVTILETAIAKSPPSGEWA